MQGGVDPMMLEMIDRLGALHSLMLGRGLVGDQLCARRSVDHERAIAVQHVAELRPEQNERGHHDRDRRLHACDRRVEIVNDLRDRHVHHA